MTYVVKDLAIQLSSLHDPGALVDTQNPSPWLINPIYPPVSPIVLDYYSDQTSDDDTVVLRL